MTPHFNLFVIIVLLMELQGVVAEGQVVLHGVDEHDELLLRCHDKEEEMESEWYLDGVPLNNSLSNAYVVKDVQTHDTGLYYCSSKMHFVYLLSEQDYLPPTKVLGRVKKILRGKNEEVLLKCISEEAKEMSIKWFRNTDLISNSNKLVLSNLSEGMSGLYWCEAEAVYLHVSTSASLLIRPKSPLVVTRSGGDALIPCIGAFDNVDVQLTIPQNDNYDVNEESLMSHYLEINKTFKGFALNNASLLHHGLWLQCLGKYETRNESIDFHLVLDLGQNDDQDHEDYVGSAYNLTSPSLDLSSLNKLIGDVSEGSDVQWVLIVHNIDLDVLNNNIEWIEPMGRVVNKDDRHDVSLTYIGDNLDHGQMAQVVFKLFGAYSKDVGVHQFSFGQLNLPEINVTLEVEDAPYFEIENAKKTREFDNQTYFLIDFDEKELALLIRTSQESQVRLRGSIQLCKGNNECFNNEIEDKVVKIADYEGYENIDLDDNNQNIVSGQIWLEICNDFAAMCSEQDFKLMFVDLKEYNEHLMHIEQLEELRFRCSAIKHIYGNLSWSEHKNSKISNNETPWALTSTLILDKNEDFNQHDFFCRGITKKGTKYALNINSTSLIRRAIIKTNAKPPFSLLILTLISLILLLLTVMVLVALLLLNKHKLNNKLMLTPEELAEIRETCLRENNTESTYIATNKNEEEVEVSKNESIPMMSSGKSYVNAYLLPFESKYEIRLRDLKFEHELGSGSSGLVFRALYKEKVVVAVKTLVKPDVGQMKDLITEAKVLSYVGKHANLVGFFGICTQKLRQRQLYLVLELCAKGNLMRILLEEKKRREEEEQQQETIFVPKVYTSNTPNSSYITLQEAKGQLANSSSCSLKSSLVPLLLKWSLEIARGMAYLARLRILHADLATRNVLIDQLDVAKIADFGLARILKASSSPNSNLAYTKRTLNTALPVRWMAPESLTHLVFSTESDVFAFGVTLWEIFALGKTPHEEIANDDDLIVNLLCANFMPKPKLMHLQLYNEIVIKCWSKEPESRPTFDQIVEWIEQRMKCDNDDDEANNGETVQDEIRG